LVRQPKAVGGRTFKMEFVDASIRPSFTFGWTLAVTGAALTFDGRAFSARAVRA